MVVCLVRESRKRNALRNIQFFWIIGQFCPEIEEREDSGLMLFRDGSKKGQCSKGLPRHISWHEVLGRSVVGHLFTVWKRQCQLFLIVFPSCQSEIRIFLILVWPRLTTFFAHTSLTWIRLRVFGFGWENGVSSDALGMMETMWTHCVQSQGIKGFSEQKDKQKTKLMLQQLLPWRYPWKVFFWGESFPLADELRIKTLWRNIPPFVREQWLIKPFHRYVTSSPARKLKFAQDFSKSNYIRPVFWLKQSQGNRVESCWVAMELPLQPSKQVEVIAAPWYRDSSWKFGNDKPVFKCVEHVFLRNVQSSSTWSSSQVPVYWLLAVGI